MDAHPDPAASLSRAAVRGGVAGLLGTATLNATTYLDMAVRGRGSSSMPADAVGAGAARAGVSLGADAETAAHRREGIGALGGYLTGVTVGAAYGVLAAGRRPSPVLAAPLVAASAMTATDVPLTASGLTDPRTWGVAGWLADIVPHLAFGAAVAVAFDRLSRTSHD